MTVLFSRQGKNDMNYQKCFGTPIRADKQTSATSSIDAERVNRSFLRQKAG
jgi:hypothetical protein